MDTLIGWIGKVPTTNARILVTLVLAIGTAIRYWLGGPSVAVGGVILPGWTPSIEWLGFIAALGGLDVAQFHSKRTTDADYVSARTGTLPTALTPPANGAPS